MLYLIVAFSLVAVGLAAVAAYMAAQSVLATGRLRDQVAFLSNELEKQWKLHNYLHARTRALLDKLPEPDPKDFV